jgi:hypothetical protein
MEQENNVAEHSNANRAERVSPLPLAEKQKKHNATKISMHPSHLPNIPNALR